MISHCIRLTKHSIRHSWYH